MAGATAQTVSGAGSFGRLELNNSNGATALTNITMQNDLVLTTGIFTINSNLLTLGPNSNLGGAPYSLTKMIKTDGVSSALGLTKFFLTSTAIFTYPVGVSGKYTPADFNITGNTSLGYYVNVSPVNQTAPSVLDPNNVLRYYWKVESSGINGFTGNVAFNYKVTDVVGGPENIYVTGWLETPGTLWNKSTPGPATDHVDESLHNGTFYFSNLSNISGNYTCGTDTAIPSYLPTYVSIVNGLWTDNSIWQNVSTGLMDCPVGGPVGFKVIVNSIVTINTNNRSAFETTITGNGKLKVMSPTYGHSLGNVDADTIAYPNLVPGSKPTLYLESGNLPAGTYTSFIDCASNTILEYGGTGNYSIILSGFTSIPNLYLTGTGTRILPNTDLTICQRLMIDGPTLDNSSNNKMLIIQGTFERYNGGVFTAGSGVGAKVSFEGSSAQTVGGSLGDFTGVNAFNHLQISNTNGLTVNTAGAVEITGNLYLTNGIITTSSTGTLNILNASITAVIPTGGATTSFVNGPLKKQFLNGNSFLFPIGKGITKGHNCTVTSTTAASSSWTAEYFTPNPTGFQANLNPPLVEENEQEYWNISSAGTQTAKVRLAWDSQSDLNGSMTMNGYSDLIVAKYNGAKWDSVTSTPSGTNSLGDVITTNSLTFTASTTSLTIGSIAATKPIATFSPTGPVCGNAGIPVTFTSNIVITLPFTLTYTVDGGAPQSAVVNALPYTLPTTVLGGVYLLTDFLYDNSTLTGSVDPTTVTVYAAPNTSNAGPNQSLCGVTSTLLAANVATAPATGLWTIISGTGGTIMSNSSPTSNFLGLLGKTYVLKWTISNASCSSIDSVSITFSYAPPQPLGISGPSPACQATTGNSYSIPAVTGATSYTWTYSGTGSTINGTTNTVTVNYNSTATSGPLSVSAVNACGVSVSRTTSITITPTPIATFDYITAPFCYDDPNQFPTMAPGAVTGLFSSSAGLVFVSTATGEINIPASTPGTYIITNTIAPTGGCSVITAKDTIILYALSTWLGVNSTDWFDVNNWSCGLPSPTVDAIVPVVTTVYPVITAAGAACKNMIMASGASITISTTENLDVYSNWTSNGTFNANSGSVTFKNISTIGGTAVTTFHNFIIANTATVTGPAGMMNLSGNWVDSGTYNRNTSTIIFMGSNLQNISSLTAETFYRLTMIKPSNVLAINNNIFITTGLTLTSGKIILASYNLTLGTTTSNITILPSPVTSESYVVADGTGVVKQYVNSSGAAATVDVNLYRFPIGDAINYSPCAIHLKSATRSNGAFITARVTDARIPGPWISSYSVYLTRFWNIDPSNSALLSNYTFESYVYYLPSPDAIGGDIYGTGSVAPCKVDNTLTTWEDAIPSEMLDTPIPSAMGLPIAELRWDNRATFGVFSGRASTLPVKLVDFTAKYDGKKAVDLEWETASEINSDYFTIERSVDGINFFDIGTQPCAGNSVNMLYYNFKDESPIFGQSYYRLKQTDYDGEFEYSKSRSVYIGNDGKKLTFEIYPNPNHGSEINLTIHGGSAKTLLLNIIDMNGKLCVSKVLDINNSKSSNYIINPDQKLAAGIYFVNIYFDEKSWKQKLIVE